MQRPEDLRRVAREAVEDLAADGVVYAELRWAPEQHQQAGLSLTEAVDAVQAGIDDGVAAVRASGTPMVVGQLLTAMRHASRGLEIAKIVVDYRDRGVFGFDIAGAEDGFPPILHFEAFEYLRRENAHFTIHAGEAFGLPSIWQAVQRCGADRLGHGV
ncbi:adenosine deaminase, partial [Aeromicrobium phragmitis]